MTKHAAQRMVERNISVGTIRAIIKESKKSKERYYDPHADHKSYIAWCDRRNIAIAFPKKTTGRAEKVIKSVIKYDKKPKRWIKEWWRF